MDGIRRKILHVHLCTFLTACTIFMAFLSIKITLLDVKHQLYINSQSGIAVVTLSSLKWRLVYFLVNNMTLQFQVLYWRRQSSWKHILIHIRMDVDLELFTVQKVLEHFLQLLGRSYYNLDASIPSSYICIVLHPCLFGYSNCQWKD